MLSVLSTEPVARWRFALNAPGIVLVKVPFIEIWKIRCMLLCRERESAPRGSSSEMEKEVHEKLHSS